MDRTVPKPAARILDFIARYEAPGGYDVVYANQQHRLEKPLTQMTLKEVLDQGKWRKNAFGSSACGRYQFMDKTLRDLSAELGLKAAQIFDPNLQDRLGYHLLRRRGYDLWVSGKMSDTQFTLNLSKEWAALPVPFRTQGHRRTVERGQSYYSGIGANKSRVNISAVESMLKAARNEIGSIIDFPSPSPPVDTNPRPDEAASLWLSLLEAAARWFADRKKV